VKNRRWVVVCAVAMVIAAAAMWRVGTVKGDEWKPISPEELKMTSVAEAPGAPAIYLYRQVDRNDAGVQRARGASEYNYVRIKVLAEQGREEANVVISYEKGLTSISGIHARTVQPDGKISEFDGKIFDQIVEKKKGRKVSGQDVYAAGCARRQHHRVPLQHRF